MRHVTCTWSENRHHLLTGQQIHLSLGIYANLERLGGKTSLWSVSLALARSDGLLNKGCWDARKEIVGMPLIG